MLHPHNPTGDRSELKETVTQADRNKSGCDKQKVVLVSVLLTLL